MRIDLETTGLVESALELDGGERGMVRVRERLPGHITLSTHAATRQLLVLAESHHDGWHARVNGEVCEVLRVYWDFMGCVVPAGSHEVHFDFDPESLRLGKKISALGLVLLLPLGVAIARAKP